MSGEDKVRHVAVWLDAGARRHFRKERFDQRSSAGTFAAFGQELRGEGKQGHVLLFPFRPIVQAQSLPLGPVRFRHVTACQRPHPYVAAFGFEAGLVVGRTCKQIHAHACSHTRTNIRALMDYVEES